MDVQSYLNQVADLVDNEHEWNPDKLKKYVSKFDGSYITLEGMEDDVKFLAELEITDELTHGVGFSSLHNKWFGWSHRACYGFTIGSKCEKGDCHYTPKTIEDYLEYLSTSWIYEDKQNVRGHIEGADIVIEYDSITFDDDKNLLSYVPKTRYTKDEYTLGKGEWTAETMEDAKQMAIDFSEGVS